MKATKILAGVAAVAMVGACGVALAGCGGSEVSSSVKTYTKVIDGADYAEWKDANEQPFSTGSGNVLWGFDTWLPSGTHVNMDEDGNPEGVTYEFRLVIDEDCALLGYVEYEMSLSCYAEPTEDLYKEPTSAIYLFSGYAYEIDGGYHLMVPNYAEITIISECAQETFQNGLVPQAQYDGPNGGTLYYWYCNSDMFMAGVKFDFPFISNILEGMYACDVLVSGADITEFKVTTEQAPLYDAGAGTIGGPQEGDDEEEDEDKAEYIYENSTWEAAGETGETGTYTYSEAVAGFMPGEEFNWTVEVALAENGDVTVHATSSEVEFGPNDLTFKGTYVVTETEMDGKLIIIKGLEVQAQAEGGIPGGKDEGAAPSEYSFVFTNASGNTIFKVGEGNVLSLLEVPAGGGFGGPQA